MSKRHEFWQKKLGKGLIPANKHIEMFIRKPYIGIINDDLFDLLETYNVKIVELDYYTYKVLDLKKIKDLHNETVEKTVIDTISELLKVFNLYTIQNETDYIAVMNKTPSNNGISIFLNVVKNRKFYFMIPEENISILKLSL